MTKQEKFLKLRIRETEKVAEYLWDILDSIDSLPDMIHPSREVTESAYFKGVERRHKLRFNVGVTDGYTVSFVPVPNNVEQP